MHNQHSGKMLSCTLTNTILNSQFILHLLC